MSSSKSAPIEQAVLVHVNDLEEMAIKVNRSIACIQRTLQAAQKILAEGIVSDEGKPK